MFDDESSLALIETVLLVGIVAAVVLAFFQLLVN